MQVLSTKLYKNPRMSVQDKIRLLILTKISKFYCVNNHISRKFVVSFETLIQIKLFVMTSMVEFR